MPHHLPTNAPTNANIVGLRPPRQACSTLHGPGKTRRSRKRCRGNGRIHRCRCQGRIRRSRGSRRRLKGSGRQLPCGLALPSPRWSSSTVLLPGKLPGIPHYCNGPAITSLLSPVPLVGVRVYVFPFLSFLGTLRHQYNECQDTQQFTGECAPPVVTLAAKFCFVSASRLVLALPSGRLSCRVFLLCSLLRPFNRYTYPPPLWSGRATALSIYRR